MYIIKPVPFDLFSISEPENDAPVWVSTTTYNTGSVVIRNGAIFVSTIDNNLNLDPDLEIQSLTGARWLRRSATNIRQFFDGSLFTKTVGTSPLVIEIEMGGTFNTIALLGLVASKTLVEIVTGTVTTVIKDIRSGPEPVDNWFDWLNTTFFDNANRVIVDEGSGFSGSIVRVTIEGPNPAIGELVVGRRIRIGTTKLDGITKMRKKMFSTIDRNEFGDTTVTQRASARDVTYSVMAKRDGFDAKAKFLDNVDGVMVVTYADRDWEQYINYGFITDWELPAKSPSFFMFEITTQGVS